MLDGRNTASALGEMIESAKGAAPLRIAVVDAAQPVVLETLQEAQRMGLAEPILIGQPDRIRAEAAAIGWDISDLPMISASGDAEAGARACAEVRAGRADAIKKGNVHTDVLMRALLNSDTGLRLPDRRVSHVFVTELQHYPKLLGITDAAINIAPDLNAKADILRNAVELFHLIGVAEPRVAVVSAVETVTGTIASSLDAACLTLMARRGQIAGAVVDGPLAFDNAISADAADEKGIVSDVAGQADILLVPDLVSGNMLAKSLEYLAGAVAAGLVVGLACPVILSSRADPKAARIAGIAVAARMHRGRVQSIPPDEAKPAGRFGPAPQTEDACCPLPVKVA